MNMEWTRDSSTGMDWEILYLEWTTDYYLEWSGKYSTEMDWGLPEMDWDWFKYST